MSDGTWHHLVLRRQGNTFSIFVDGVNSAEQTIAGFGNLNVSESLTMGYCPHGLSIADALEGTLDEVRIYVKALTDAEINSISLGIK